MSAALESARASGTIIAIELNPTSAAANVLETQRLMVDFFNVQSSIGLCLVASVSSKLSYAIETLLIRAKLSFPFASRREKSHE